MDRRLETLVRKSVRFRLTEVSAVVARGLDPICISIATGSRDSRRRVCAFPAGLCAELAHARYDRQLLLKVRTTHSAITEPGEFLRIAHRQGLQLAAQVNNVDEPHELERVSGSASG